MQASKNVAIIVAHPDDEILWAGGTIISHPSWQFFIVCTCRGGDIERATKFCETLNTLNIQGVMGDLDDGPEQIPLDENDLENTIMNLLPFAPFDLVITHDSKGEYTRHLRHEEVNKAVISLWHSGRLAAREIWTFAYEDGNKKYYPKAIKNGTICTKLSKRVWLRKYKIITETYGFNKESWEARTTPEFESFWQLRYPYSSKNIINKIS